MSSKSQLSYIMDLLDIIGTQLATYLDLDRTLISKWKNNVRPLKTSNKHFDKVIDGLIHFNTQSKKASLERFFNQNYPQEDNNEPDYLQNCLKLWLEGEDSGAFFSLNHWKTAKDALYASKIDIYQGNEGKRSAILAFFEYASTLPSGQEIFISDVEGTLWREEDSDFNLIYHRRINELAKQGHNITLILTEEITTKKPTALVFNRINAYFTGHITSYLLKHTRDNPQHSYYIIHRQMAVISSCATRDTSLRFITINRDPFSLKHYVALFIERMKQSEPLLSSYAIQGKSMDYFLKNYEKKHAHSSMIISAPELPVCMISKNLLLKKLESYNIPDKIISKIMKINEQKSNIIFNDINNKDVDILLSKHAFQAMVTSENIRHDDLSRLCDQDIYLSPEDIKETLCHWKNISRKYPTLHLVLIEFDDIFLLDKSRLFIFKDHFMIATQMNNKSYFLTTDSTIVLNQIQDEIQSLLLHQETKNTFEFFCKNYLK